VPESSRSTIIIWLVAAALAVVAGIRLLGGGDSPAPPVSIDGAPAGGSVGATGGRGSSGPRAGNGAGAGATASGAELYVHVAGAVRKPGLIRLPSGTRVATALERAGGPTRRADLTLVNLAARLQDGQQIVVPVAGAAGGAGATGGGAGAATGGAANRAGSVAGAKLHLSTATAEQLDEVDGIGPTLAERIVEYRDEHGGFRSLEGLAEVEGIGEKRLATLRDALQP
jgi:competence protein ComEA